MREKLREEWKKLRGMPLREALEYLWDYYRYLTLGVILAVVAVVSLTVSISTNASYKPSLRCGVLNTVRPFAEGYFEEASMELFGITCDTTGGIGLTTCYEPSDSANYGAVQLLCQLAADEVDMILCDTELRDYLSKEGALGGQLVAMDVTDTALGRLTGADAEHPIFLIDLAKDAYRDAAGRFLAYVLDS